MAETIYRHPIAELHGALSKRSGIINRQKKYRDELGRIIHEGKNETYAVNNPRDFKKTPRKGAELANFTMWQQACQRTTQILQAARPEGPSELDLSIRRMNGVPEFYTLEEARALYEDFRLRFQKQLPKSRGKHADAQAPIDRKTGLPKRYAQLSNFICAMIYHQLKKA